jgi:hypothetical protein
MRSEKLHVPAAFIPLRRGVVVTRFCQPRKDQVPAGHLEKIDPFGRIVHALGRPNDGESFPLVLFTRGHNGSFPQSNMALLIQNGGKGLVPNAERYFCSAA